MKRTVIVAAVFIGLLAAGGASAYALGTIWLGPGHCTKVHGQKVCARNVAPKTVGHIFTTTVNHTDTVTATQTVTQTVTVYPSPIGNVFSGNRGKTLAPMTLSAGDEISWTSSPDAYNNNIFSVSSSLSDSNYVTFDNGNSSTSGSTFIPAGSYTFQVIATGAWTISF